MRVLLELHMNWSKWWRKKDWDSSEKTELIKQLKIGYEEALKQKDRLIAVWE